MNITFLHRLRLWAMMSAFIKRGFSSTMISSMTAFSSRSETGAFGVLSCDIRSVNHRYLDTVIYLPDPLQTLEPVIRKYLQNRVQRGKVEVMIRLQPGEGEAQAFKINQLTVGRLAEVAKVLSTTFMEKAGLSLPFDMKTVLAWPGVREMPKPELYRETVLDLFQTVLDDYLSIRHQEGNQLKERILATLNLVKIELDRLKVELPETAPIAREKIRARFKELSLSVDEGRLEQEIVWLAQKADVTEELQRLEIHLEAVREALEKGGGVGRRLDFLMQELHREVNTLNSKSIRLGVIQTGLELKVYIEQMREQIQNIE